MPGSDRARNVLLLLTTCILLAAAGEAGLRAWQAVSKGTAFFTFLPGHPPGTRFQNNPFLVFGPRLNVQLEGKEHPEWSSFNHQGFRTRDTVGPRPDGEYRVVALGGSTTEDANTTDGSHWPLTLQRTLAAMGRPDVRVLNAGMSAYSTAHSLVRLQFDVLQYEPDLVIVMHNINDLSVNYYAAHFDRTVDPAYHVKYGTKAYTGVVDDGDVVVSRLWHSVAVRVRHLLRGVPDGDISDSLRTQEGQQAFERNLEGLVAIARSRGVDVLFLTMPVSRSRPVYEATRDQARGADPGFFPSYERFLRDFDTYNDAIERVGEQQHVCVVDMDAMLRGHDDDYFVDVVHYSDSGSDAFGRGLAAELLPQLPPAGARDGRTAPRLGRGARGCGGRFSAVPAGPR